MFLKSIEIRGFKSFADKTELNFTKGVTAVVGPNGSGKSNITDAVRWVLGEQSIKSLRGGKMEDVIFAGTQFRKPVGLAQVALTLDNSDGKLQLDYSDVTISRRLYRSGESEYYINNTQCRLKDVQELFMDTGIGKEGYSIIGQGKIDAILSGKPEERRSLLEEAAGIVKFKSRKEDAERKLNNTEQNLVRINDIISTYEERLEPLRIENEKAQSFIKLSSELKYKEVNVILDSIEKIKKRLAHSNEEFLALQKEIDFLNLSKAEFKNNSKEWSNKLEEFEKLVGDQKKDYYESKSLQQKLQSESDILKERIDNLTNLIAKENKDLLSIEDKLKELYSLKSQNDNNFEELKINVNNLDEQIDTESKLIQKSAEELRSSIDEIDRLKNEKIELLSFISNSKNDLNILNNDIEIIENKIQQLEAANESYDNSIKINFSTKSILEKETTSIKEKINLYEAEIINCKRDFARLNQIVNDDERTLKTLNAEFNKCEANRNMLINLDKHYEGYNKAVKTLMQHVDDNRISNAKDNCFILGEVIKVEHELEIAIEVSLGGGISDIITSDEKLAKNLIEYLKTNNIGRATFLPLTIINGKTINLPVAVNTIDGFLGIASELVNYNSKFKKAIEYVLGRTIIAKDMDSALKIAKVTNYSFKIVSLTGEVVNPGGSLTGGSSYQKNVSIIGRKREIDELATKLKSIEKDIENKTTLITENNKKIKAVDDKALNLKDEIHYENIEITKIQGKISAIETDTIKLQQNIKIALEEIENLNSKFIKNKSELQERKESIEDLVNKEGVNDTRIEELELMVKDKNAVLAENNSKITELKIKKAQMEEILISNKQELDRINKEVAENKEKQNDLVVSISNNEAQENGYSLDKERILDKIAKIIKSIESMESNFKESEEEIINIKSNLSKNNEKLEEITMIFDKKEEAAHRAELNIAKFETEQEAVYSKLNEEMELTFAEAIEFKMEFEDINDLKKDILNIKAQINTLGTVNLGAIEEYQQIKEKYIFMSTQREDLNTAIKEIISVIEEMTSKMRAMFNENFAILRANFNETFKELFKGGSADLILSDGDELTSNIEINVQPPGKKLQNINLMSGGEKVLSAIALLFAILKMKPTPFCILDEIEAALDDANVFRYAEFLNKFSETTQFIVITHRKGTMEASDNLYGVTMEEKGVSKIVSVNLAN